MEENELKTYIYPENLRATVKLWFWNVRDFLIICGGIIISAVIFAKLLSPVPMAMAAGFAFITIRAEDTSILDYIVNAVRFFCTSQQEYHWRKGGDRYGKAKEQYSGAHRFRVLHKKRSQS